MFFTNGVNKSRSFYSCEKYVIYFQKHEKLNQDEHLVAQYYFV